MPVHRRTRIAVLASGEGHTFEAVIEGCVEGRVHGDVVVVCGNRSTAGVADRARRHGIAFVHLSAQTHPADDARDRAMCEVLVGAGVDLVLLLGYLKPLGPQLLDRWQGRVLNVHPSLLPAFGGPGMYGRHVHEAVLASGTRCTGATVHSVTTEYDAGPVIARTVVEVLPSDDIDCLEARVKRAEQRLLVDVLADWTQRGGPELRIFTAASQVRTHMAALGAAASVETAGMVELDHGLQCAALLQRDFPRDIELQVAGLLHDLAHPWDASGQPNHAWMAAAAVRPLFGERIARLIEAHVAAKRYLVATRADYRARLSPTSVATLAAQGGAMSDAECRAFEAQADWQAAVALRLADDNAKVRGAVVPDLSSWLPVIDACVARQLTLETR